MPRPRRYHCAGQVEVSRMRDAPSMASQPLRGNSCRVGNRVSLRPNHAPSRASSVHRSWCRRGELVTQESRERREDRFRTHPTTPRADPNGVQRRRPCRARAASDAEPNPVNSPRDSANNDSVAHSASLWAIRRRAVRQSSRAPGTPRELGERPVRWPDLPASTLSLLGSS
jgi:hypothetical protein